MVNQNATVLPQRKERGKMKTRNSILFFILFAISVEALLMFLINEPITLRRAMFGFGWASICMLIYKYTVDVNKPNWIADELRSYLVRNQPSNRFMFAFTLSFMLLPMNALIWQMDIARLMFLQISAVLMAELIFFLCGKIALKYALLNSEKITAREVKQYGCKEEIRPEKSCNFKYPRSSCASRGFVRY